jgi:uncharacterized membrane protein YdbT with pleckstrin-like domain
MAHRHESATKQRTRKEETGKNMSLVTIVITLIVVGVLLWLVNTYIPMDGKIKKVLNIVVMVVVVLWLLNVFGVWGHLHDVRVSKQLPTQLGLVMSPEISTRV